MRALLSVVGTRGDVQPVLALALEVRALGHEVRLAVRACGRRAIVAAGWGALSVVDDGADCCPIDEVNQQALFPRLAAVIHHGGAGTTLTAARAGVPQIVAPMFSDQPYWASRVSALGIGTSVPFAQITADAVANVLGAALVPSVAARAREVAGRIRLDGAADAARRLVDFVARAS